MLTALLDPSLQDMSAWSPEDLAAILEHQLSTLLSAEMDRFTELGGHTSAQATKYFADAGCRTFRDVFTTVPPSPKALSLVKDYAKASLRPGGSLPPDVARVMYVAAIVRAANAGLPSISTLDGATVRREARRCLTFAWVPEPIRELLRYRPRA